MSPEPGTQVDPAGRVWALRCSCGGHPTTGHPARPIGQVEAPPVTTTPAPVGRVSVSVTRRPGEEGPKAGRTYHGGTTGRGTTRRRRTFRPRAAAFVDLATRHGVTDEGHQFTVPADAGAGVNYLLRAVPEEVERVFVLGARPGGGTLDGFYEWASSVGRKWAPAEQGHYMENPELPVLRYELAGGEGPVRKLEILRAKAWFGDVATTPAAAVEGLAMVGKLLGAAFDGATLLATPATTGRDLFVRSIPAGCEWPVLDDETQELVRSTTGQGRIELFPHDGEIPRLVEVDGRFMYAALCWGLGVGPVDRTTRGDAVLAELSRDGRAIYRPARYRVRCTIPAGWSRAGLLGVMHDERSRGWFYPSSPGETLTTWCDGAELFVVLRAGWSVKVLERVGFQSASGRGPLDTWSRKLGALWRDLWPGDDEPEGSARHLARAALRSLLLHSLGAFVGRGHVVTRSVPVTQSRRVPADAINLREEGGHLWFGVRRAPAWPEMAHPEWPAAVWARCRARMLSGPGATGVLHVPAADVLAIRTDALYLTSDPGWPDDGKIGRLRVKAVREGPHPAPRSVVELLRLREGR